MGDCGVCIGGDPEGYCEFSTIVIRKARKAHKCCECDKTISPGEKYEYAVMKFEGDLLHEKTCLVCAEIATAFYCNGRTFGGALWQDMEYSFESMTVGCLNRLTTGAAKAELQRRWNEWKGLSA